MKFSSTLLAAFTVQASAFSTPSAAVKGTHRYAATLEAPVEDKTNGPVPSQVNQPSAPSMDVEKDWPVEEFVKDSDRVMP
ncbi:hypothetical protein HJC23_007563 [Cyclotella cryptica]|uniref:Uncharacterized protein n=1 Tax=Cyclotella cryptica TaxID=29204 RepID=A0ABD3QSB0_9STRA